MKRFLLVAAAVVLFATSAQATEPVSRLTCEKVEDQIQRITDQKAEFQELRVRFKELRERHNVDTTMSILNIDISMLYLQSELKFLKDFRCKKQ